MGVVVLGAAALVVPLCAAVPAVAAASTAQPERKSAFVERMEELYSSIEREYRPDVRWWLAEGLNTDETLRENVEQIADSGFGSVEILAMPEPGADDAVYGWGSQEWTNDTRLVIEETTERGLGFSLTSGTHWATANLPDTYVWDGAPFDYDNKAASQELDYGTVLVGSGETFDGVLPKPPLTEDAANVTRFVFEGVVAAKLTEVRPESGQDHEFDEGTQPGELELDSLVDLSDQVVRDGDTYSLNWTAPDDGQYALFAYWMHGSGQTAEPSVSTNYAINYIDPYGVEAMKDYWESEVFTPELLDQIRENGRGEIYMDSLEIESFATAGLLWGAHFREEFEARRGYDVTPYLPIVTWDRGRHDSDVPAVYDYEAADADDEAVVTKIRNDLNQTFSELYEENVLKPLQDWLHGFGMTLRAEPSYGMQFEISTPAKYLDGVETETFAQNGDLDVYRGMLGSAHMYDLPFSSETGAVGGHNYYYDMDHWTQMSYLQFAGGVNRVVFHGYSGIEGSESATQWPGHEGMYSVFSDRFGGRQPASAFYPEWTEMLGRNQKVLRQGRPQRDIAILRTDNRFISYGQPDEFTPPENSYFMNDMPYFWKDLSLQHAGYTYDYFSPQLLEDEENVSWTGDQLQPDGPGYRAIILYQDSLELSSAKRLLEIAKDGIPVIFVNNTSEIRTHEGPEIAYEQAASKTRFLGDDEAELKSVVDEIKALPNARELDEQSDTLATLRSLGVQPRVAYEEPNNKIMTVSRLDKEENVLYTFVHSFKFEKNKGEGPTTFDLSIEGAGKPYTIDDWSGDVKPVGTFRNDGERTNVEVTLEPGEAEIIAIDLSDPDAAAAVVSTDADQVVEQDGKPAIVATQTGQYTSTLTNGGQAVTDVVVPDQVPLPTWDITVEDWNEGEKVINTEEKFGHITREAYWTTKKTPLKFPDSELVPWKDLPATPEQLASIGGEDASMSHVSGMGTYRTSFELPRNWKRENGAYLDVGSTNGALTEIVVNGKKAPALDTRTLRTDISDLVRKGENEVEITVASTLTNRLLQRGYDTRGPAQDHGLVGDVRVVPYTVAVLEDTQRPTVSLESPTSGGPFRKLNVHVDATDNRGLQKIVANVYRGGRLVKSTQSAANGAKSASHTATAQLPDGQYTVKYNAHDVTGNVSRTGTFAFRIDGTAPSTKVKDGLPFTVNTGETYDMISFKLHDAGKIDKVTLNGTVKDLVDNPWSDVNFIRPPRFGAVEGTNTLVVYDVAGNTSTVEFTLN